MKNILTVDLEDWFSVEILNTLIDPGEWSALESVVERNTDLILDLFDRHKVKATFFVLGWVADRYPNIVQMVAAAGHEISCHSYYHHMVSSMTPDEFRRDTELAVGAIINACGRVPAGYRSPSWGMRRDMEWAYEILGEFDFAYDSSIYPIRHDIYGDPTAPRRPYEVYLPSGKTIVEIPASTVTVFGRRMPIGGGGWLRQFPYWFTRWGIRKLNRAGEGAMIYFHPWELDPDLPRVGLDLKNRIRQYGNLNTMRIKVEKLLDDFDFIPIGEYIKTLTLDKAS